MKKVLVEYQPRTDKWEIRPVDYIGPTQIAASLTEALARCKEQKLWVAQFRGRLRSQDLHTV